VRYEFYAESNAVSQKWRSFVEETEQIAWSKIEIQKIFKTNVTIRQTTKFRNETQVTTIHTINVKTGEGFALPVIVASNLKPGDQIFASVDFKINNTMPKSYLDINRDINYAILQKTGPLGPKYYFEITQFFWDKETGILCEMETLIYELYEPSENEEIKEYTLWKMKLVEASPDILKLWTTEDAPTVYAMLFFMVLIFLIGSLYVFYLKKRK